MYLSLSCVLIICCIDWCACLFIKISQSIRCHGNVCSKGKMPAGRGTCLITTVERLRLCALHCLWISVSGRVKRSGHGGYERVSASDRWCQGHPARLIGLAHYPDLSTKRHHTPRRLWPHGASSVCRRQRVQPRGICQRYSPKLFWIAGVILYFLMPAVYIIGLKIMSKSF